MAHTALIVNDSRVLTAVISAILETEKILIAGTVTNGKDAIEETKRLHPGIILMDIHMPVMGGVEAIKRIIQAWPKAKILITTATVSRNMTHIFDGLQNGALDFSHSPALTQTPGSKVTHEQLRQAGSSMLVKIHNILKMRKVADRNQISLDKRAPLAQKQPLARPVAISPKMVKSHVKRKFVAIGCSTGGPNTLAILLSYIPKPTDFPILVCQHIDEEFTPEFARWLHDQTHLPVKVVQDQEELIPGQIYVTLGGSRNITITSGGRAAYEPTQSHQIYFPNINHLFQSMATNLKKSACGVVLTGLGDDGAKGLASIKNAGGGAFVQSATSAVAPSMPLAARDLARLSLGFDLPQLATMVKGWTQKS